MPRIRIKIDSTGGDRYYTYHFVEELPNIPIGVDMSIKRTDPRKILPLPPRVLYVSLSFYI